MSDYYYWKHYKRTSESTIDHDASLDLTKNGKIKKLHFRADLREPHLTFLTGFIEIAKKYDCLLLDIQGNLISPEEKQVYKLIKLSNSYKFLTNPEKFLNDLSNS